MSAHFQDSTFCIELCRPVALLEKTSVSETTDVSTSLKPEFVVVVDKSTGKCVTCKREPKY